ncbi:DUF3151 domain-containing protein [Corynebacterium gerontici]|uniref:DUF3151 domain-containing protein n=1 Tax=Corynebacterium gerontici TaxID=2079234 RepID=A0A3G6IYT3_9CORY|nr:DUF3151 domain-containing protein [Corynebacterium gerontici]AZA10837.1 hypothetical protein CGERO_02565 [Corynebacterium gerontici]
MTEFNDMLAPPPMHLPEDQPASTDPSMALKHPASPAIWASLAVEAIDHASTDMERVHAYALARTGYHRSLDRLRAAGWKGWGPIPFEHEPNQGVLKSIACLALASKMIGDDAEYERCRQMLSDADPQCVAILLESE